MASAAPVSITELPRGHEFSPAVFALSADDVQAYLAATGDATPYGEHAPPLAAVALALAALQQQLSLPNGALHTGQEIEHRRAIAPGATLTFRGRVAQRSERQGFVISVVELEIEAGGQTAIAARATIMAPGTPA
jgi:hypothetical protein